MTDPQLRRVAFNARPVVDVAAEGVRVTALSVATDPALPDPPPDQVLPVQDLPVAGTAADTLLADRNDPNAHWAIGASTLSPAAADFTFAAVQDGIDKSGNLTNHATLTFTVTEPDAADVAAVRAQADQTVKPVPPITTEVTYHLGFVNDDGSPGVTDIPATAEPRPDGALVVSVALFGPQVVQAAHALMDPTAVPSSLTVQRSYSAWQQTQLYGPIDPHPPRRFPERVITTDSPISAERLADARLLAEPPAAPAPVDAAPVRGIDRNLMVSLPALRSSFLLANIERAAVTPSTTRWLVTTATSVQEVPVGPAFAGDAARGRYTLTIGGQLHPLTGPGDLTSFTHPVSEYRELTSLGDVPAKFPSLRALYVGQQSGRVVAIPQRYAIVRGHDGLQARCDAVIDGGAESLSGCEFTFAFTVQPDVSPVDYALLGQALTTCPEATTLPLQLTLPSGLDSRTPPAASPIAVLNGSDPFTLTATITVRDQPDLPAVTAANLVLAQLAADGPSPLATTLAVRLDDAYPTPVETALVLNIRDTAPGADLALSATADVPARLQITNACPYPEVLVRGLGAGGGIVDLGRQVLAPAADVTVAVDPAVTATLPAIERTLQVPSPLPGSDIGSYVTLNVDQVQEVQHAIVVNGAALHFSADGLTSLDIAFTLDDDPQLGVPGFTLQDGHVADSTHVLIPVVMVVSGLATTVSLTKHTAAGPQPPITLAHDFVSEPILVLTPDLLA